MMANLPRSLLPTYISCLKQIKNVEIRLPLSQKIYDILIIGMYFISTIFLKGIRKYDNNNINRFIVIVKHKMYNIETFVKYLHNMDLYEHVLCLFYSEIDSLNRLLSFLSSIETRYCYEVYLHVKCNFINKKRS